MGRVLSLRDLNRTLLQRQHLLERTTLPALDMVEHLIGLQAQENLPPYLSLAARIEDFDPLELSDALEDAAGGAVPDHARHDPRAHSPATRWRCGPGCSARSTSRAPRTR